MGSVVALAGFAGAANATATVDLIWIDTVTGGSDTSGPICLKAPNRNCPRLGSTISSVDVTDEIVLLVLLTAGPNGVIGGGVSLDYNDALPKVSVTGFQSFLTKHSNFGAWFPSSLGTTTDLGGVIDNINATAVPFTGTGIGLPAGESAYLGTVSFHKDQLINGTSEISAGTGGPGGTDGLGNLGYADISATTTFNSAFLVNVPEPGALSLLVMGLGGMLLAGRGRRS
jgi:hypothetical protein